MDFLQTKNLIIDVIPENTTLNNTKELIIKFDNRIYKGILPKKIITKKYNLDELIIKYIFESNILNVDFDDFNGLMNIYIDNLEFNNGKKYPDKVKIEMKRYFNIYDDIIQDNDNIKKTFCTLFDYVKILENKMSKLEEEIYSLKEINDKQFN